MARFCKSVAFASCIGLVGCGLGQSQAIPASWGFLVIGPDAAAKFGLSAGDTLQEHPSRTVPRPVVVGAEAAATALRFTPECSRYFSESGIFVTLLKAGCDSRAAIEDGEALAAFLATGQSVGLIPNLTSRDYTALEPGTRDPRP